MKSTLPLQEAPPQSPWFRKQPALIGVCLAVIAAVATLLLIWIFNRPNPTRASMGSCRPSATLVNPCRPWLGAAVHGNPSAASDPISQFDYLERLIGYHMDIYRDYHSPPDSGNSNADLPLNATEIHFAERADTYIDVNWKPADTWAQADGSDPAINAKIAKAADSIKRVAPHKIFLTVWWEPQQDVSPGTTTACSGQTRLKGAAGSPAQYIAMWQNVENIFRAQGVSNVVWVMNYQGAPNYYCLITPLWPGNNLIDWVIYDSYDHDDTAGTTWDNTVGRVYSQLTQDSSPSVNFDSKPWGLGEFGTCKNKNPANTQQYFLDGQSALTANKYPKLKMYIVYANTGNNSGYGCLTNYDANPTAPGSNSGAYDSTKQTDFNRLARSILGQQTP